MSTPSRCRTAASSTPPATRTCSPSTAPPRSRSRRCRSPASAETRRASSWRSRAASHRAQPAQLEAAASLLAKAPATESDLECGLQEGRGPHRSRTTAPASTPASSPSAVRVGWPTEGYRSATTRCSSSSSRGRRAAELPTDEVPAAVDGCGVADLRADARAHGVHVLPLARLDGGAKIAAAMSAHPELIGYEQGATDTDLMRLRPGWIAKGGAEGLICAASPTASASRSRSRTATCAACARRSRGSSTSARTSPAPGHEHARRGSRRDHRVKVHIISDIEGCAGIVKWEQTGGRARCTRRGASSTPRRSTLRSAARRRGRDRDRRHGLPRRGRGLDVQLADPRGARPGAASTSSSRSGRGTPTFLEQGCDAALFVGMHARAGTTKGVLNHTVSGRD